jgi:hypothetical protein
MTERETKALLGFDIQKERVYLGLCPRKPYIQKDIALLSCPKIVPGGVISS